MITPVDAFFWMFVAMYVLALVIFIAGIILTVIYGSLDAFAILTGVALVAGGIGFLVMIIWGIVWALSGGPPG